MESGSECLQGLPKTTQSLSLSSTQNPIKQLCLAENERKQALASVAALKENSIKMKSLISCVKYWYSLWQSAQNTDYITGAYSRP